MMKKLLFFNFLLTSLFLISQDCEVNFSQTGFLEDPDGSYLLQIQSDGSLNTCESSFSTDLDTLTALPNISIGQNYSTSFGIRIPADTSIVYDLGAGPQLFEGVQITSISISEVQGLPAGFDYACDNADCTWSGGDFGCATIYSTGDVSGISSGSAFPLNFILSVDATYEVFGLPVPLTDIEVSDLLNFYTLVVEDGDIPETVVDIIVNSENHNILESAVVAADLANTLSGDGAFTVFAPTDNAFGLLPSGTVESLLEDPTGQLANILLHHVVSGSNLSCDLSDGITIETLNGTSLNVSIDNGTVMIDNAVVTTADLIADNGVVHVIDAVLLPNPDSFVLENFSNDKLLLTVDLEGRIVKKSIKNVVLIDIYESGKIYKRFEK